MIPRKFQFFIKLLIRDHAVKSNIPSITETQQLYNLNIMLCITTSLPPLLWTAPQVYCQ